MRISKLYKTAGRDNRCEVSGCHFEDVAISGTIWHLEALGRHRSGVRGGRCPLSPPPRANIFKTQRISSQPPCLPEQTLLSWVPPHLRNPGTAPAEAKALMKQWQRLLLGLASKQMADIKNEYKTSPILAPWREIGSSKSWMSPFTCCRYGQWEPTSPKSPAGWPQRHHVAALALITHNDKSKS